MSILKLSLYPEGAAAFTFTNHAVAFVGMVGDTWGQQDLKATYSLPSFNDNFSYGKISTDELNNELLAVVGKLTT